MKKNTLILVFLLVLVSHSWGSERAEIDPGEQYAIYRCKEDRQRLVQRGLVTQSDVDNYGALMATILRNFEAASTTNDEAGIRKGQADFKTLIDKWANLISLLPPLNETN